MTIFTWILFYIYIHISLEKYFRQCLEVSFLSFKEVKKTLLEIHVTLRIRIKRLTMTKTYMEDLEIGIQFLTTHYVSYIGCGGEQTTVYKGVETFRGVLKP